MATECFQAAFLEYDDSGLLTEMRWTEVDAGCNVIPDPDNPPGFYFADFPDGDYTVTVTLAPVVSGFTVEVFRTDPPNTNYALETSGDGGSQTVTFPLTIPTGIVARLVVYDDDGLSEPTSGSLSICCESPPPTPSDPVVTSLSPIGVLDLVGGLRSSSFRYYLLDAGNRRIGLLDADVTEGYPTISNNVNQTIKRSLSSFVLPPATRAQIDPLVHRVQPCMVLSTGDEYPLGVFLFSDLSDEEHDFGAFGHATMGDQGVILDQPASAGYSYGPGVAVADALADLFTRTGFTTWRIDPAMTAVLGAPKAWPAGTRQSVVAADLCATGGAHPVWFSNDGIPSVRAVVDLATATPEITYEADRYSRIIARSTVRSNDLLDAPNRYVVIDSSAADSPVVGYYDAPADAPHSAANRGFVVAKVITEDGLESNAAAVDRARVAYTQAVLAYEHVQFSSPPDPRHDTFQVIQFRGVNFREQSWAMTLRDGTEMRHDLRRSFGGDA